jgi:hypothetical protein
VVYVAGEGGGGITNRLKAIEQHHDIVPGETPLYIVHEAVDLTGDTGVRNILTAMREIERGFDPENAPTIALIVIDTLARCFGSGDENSAADMGRLVANLDRLRAETGAHVAVVHHTGKDVSRGGRGSSALLGAIDTAIEVSRDGTGIITAEVNKQRDGDALESLAFRLKRIEIGKDEDGDPITSCIVEPTDDAPENRRLKLTGHKKTVFEALHEAIIDCGETAPANGHLPDGKRVVRTETWRRFAEPRMIVSGQNSDTKRRTFDRAARGLQGLGLIGVWQDQVWLV